MQKVIERLATPKLMELCTHRVGAHDSHDLFAGLVTQLNEVYDLRDALDSERSFEMAINEALYITLRLFNVVGVASVKAHECPYGVVCDVAYLCLTYTKSDSFWHDRLMEVAQSALWCIKGIKANAVDVNMDVVIAEVLTIAVSGFVQGVEA